MYTDKIINLYLDVLILLCLSNNFLRIFIDFTESDINDILSVILDNLLNTHQVMELRSTLLFLSVLYCPPIQDEPVPVANQELQTNLWSLIAEFDVISKLQRVHEEAQSQPGDVVVSTWACHVLTCLARYDKTQLEEIIIEDTI